MKEIMFCMLRQYDVERIVLRKVFLKNSSTVLSINLRKHLKNKTSLNTE